MVVGIFIGKFQPFHKQHLETILKLSNKTDLVLVIPTYLQKNEKEILSPKNPIPINYRYKYISSILENYIDHRKYYILPINVLNKKLLIKFLNILKSTGEKEFLIYTRDLDRFLAYKIVSLIARLYSLHINVYYEKKTNILNSSYIRKAIIEEDYDKIKSFLPKELDKKTIMYIKYYKKYHKDLDNVLRHLISFLI
ncbi:MAG: hypothetical protein QXN76_00050 [Nanopusillaceae archaeon]